jgi:hypothetical protein
MYGLDKFEYYEQLETDMYFDSIHISSMTEAVLSNARITFINEGVRVSAPNVTVRNSCFNHSTNLFRFVGGRVVVRNVVNQGSRGNSFAMEATNTLTESFLFYNNISHSNNILPGSVNIELINTNATIQNNYFYRNSTAIRTNLNKIYLLNNEFSDNTTSYDNRGSNSTIRDNNFMGVRLREVVFRRSGNVRAFGAINRNNFHERTRTLLAMGWDTNEIMVQNNIDSSNNFFAGTDVSSQIRDKNTPGYGSLLFEFQINPRQNTVINNIGIQRAFEQ